MDMVLGWTPFHVSQLISYILIAIGTCFYSHVLDIRRWLRIGPPSLEEIMREEDERVERGVKAAFLEGKGASWLDPAVWRRGLRWPPRRGFARGDTIAGSCYELPVRPSMIATD